VYILFGMTRKSDKPAVVREPVQVYLAGDDVALLERLIAETGLSKAEILRRGLRSFGALHGGASPMLQFVESAGKDGWADDVAARHDEVLAADYMSRRAEPT
jgi:Ribbon-helix-helix protein, copG family